MGSALFHCTISSVTICDNRTIDQRVTKMPQQASGTPARKQPQRLSKKELILYPLGIVASVCALCIGTVGMMVMLGEWAHTLVHTLVHVARCCPDLPWTS